VLVAIVVFGVVLGLTVRGFFLVLVAGPIVLLAQYAWQKGGPSSGSTTSIGGRALPDKAAVPELRRRRRSRR
jgi:hypothetical protein